MRMRISGEGADVMQRGRYSTPPPENKRSAENDREKNKEIERALHVAYPMFVNEANNGRNRGEKCRKRKEMHHVGVTNLGTQDGRGRICSRGRQMNPGTYHPGA